MADLFEEMEASRIGQELSVTHITPVNDEIIQGGTVELNVGTRIPFFDQATGIRKENEIDLDITTSNASLDESGNLNIEFRATASYEADSTHDDDQQSAKPTENLGDATEGQSQQVTNDSQPKQNGANVHPNRTTMTETNNTDKKREPQQDNSSQKKELVESPCQSVSETSSENPPVYKDPERLKTVYEKKTTFEEMTEALGADVTPETIRRYMIKYNIHDPASRTGSRSAEILLDRNPDSIPIDQEGD